MNSRTILLLLVGITLGCLWANEPIANAEPHRNAPKQTFSSGAMRSEQILREISVTLHSIDARLARVETTVAKMQANAARNAPRVGGLHVQ